MFYISKLDEEHANFFNVFDSLREMFGASVIPFTFPILKGEQAVGLVDLIDLELFTGDELVKNAIAAAHARGVKVIMSNHDFHKTPAKDEIIYRLRRMQELGADIPKIALMPTCRQDVLTVLSATVDMAEKYADRPIITMSMGKTGVTSRLTGEAFGSAATFGAVKTASAPGQISVADLRTVLTIINKA